MALNELLDLLRRLPPQDVASNLEQIVGVVEQDDPDLADELLSSVDQALRVLVDSSGREFLACDFNRDSAQSGEDNGADSGSSKAKDAYRSPWTNDYVPALEDGTRPSSALRQLEQATNDAFSVYREMYYEGTGISSAYLWDLQEGSTTSFAGVVLLKKTTTTTTGGGESAANNTTTGNWDSIHVFEVEEKGRSATYKLTSTIMLYLSRNGSPELGSLQLGGSMTRQTEQSLPLDPPPSSSSSSIASFNPSHIANIGRLVEEQEIKMRNLLQEVYFAKTRDVVNDLRSLRGANEESQRKGLQGELVGLLRNRASAAA